LATEDIINAGPIVWGKYRYSLNIKYII